MRVAIIVHRLQPMRGGAETWTAQFIQWLSHHRYRVQLIASHAPDERAADFLDDHLILPCRNRIDFAHAVSSVVDQCHADVIHDMGFGYNCDIFQPHMGSQIALDQAKALCFRGVQRVVHGMIHTVGWRQRRLADIGRRQYANPRTRFLAVSSKVARDIHKFHGIAPHRIDTVFNGVDTNYFCPETCAALRSQVRAELQIAQDELTILSVAHNHLLKGIPTLVDVLRRPAARSRNLHLLIVGGHRQTPRRKQLNGNRMTFTGACEQVERYYAAADAFILPTYYDACSLTVLEAMACGLPVITTRCNGASDLLRSGFNGLVYDHPRDLDALWECLERCCDAKFRETIGRRARITAELCTLDHNFTAIADIYHRLAGQRRMAA